MVFNLLRLSCFAWFLFGNKIFLWNNLFTRVEARAEAIIRRRNLKIQLRREWISRKGFGGKSNPVWPVRNKRFLTETTTDQFVRLGNFAWSAHDRIPHWLWRLFFSSPRHWVITESIKEAAKRRINAPGEKISLRSHLLELLVRENWSIQCPL